MHQPQGKKTMNIKKADIKHLGLTICPYESSIKQAQYAIDVMDKDYTRALNMSIDDMYNAWNLDNTPQEDKDALLEVLKMLFDSDGKMNAEKMADVMRLFYDCTSYSFIIDMRGRNMHEAVYALVHYKKLLGKLA